jgi:hypothetical protein
MPEKEEKKIYASFPFPELKNLLDCLAAHCATV